MPSLQIDILNHSLEEQEHGKMEGVNVSLNRLSSRKNGLQIRIEEFQSIENEVIYEEDDDEPVSGGVKKQNRDEKKGN